MFLNNLQGPHHSLRLHFPSGEAQFEHLPSRQPATFISLTEPFLEIGCIYSAFRWLSNWKMGSKGTGRRYRRKDELAEKRRNRIVQNNFKFLTKAAWIHKRRWSKGESVIQHFPVKQKHIRRREAPWAQGSELRRSQKQIFLRFHILCPKEHGSDPAPQNLATCCCTSCMRETQNL